MKMLFRRILFWLLASLVAAALATMASTQFVLAGLSALGAEVSIASRLSMTAEDLIGMGPTFAALVAAGLLVALPVAGLLTRLLPKQRMFLYMLAGGTALATILLSMRISLGMTPIAGARTGLGFATLVVCGAIGGWFFATVTRNSLNAAA